MRSRGGRTAGGAAHLRSSALVFAAWLLVGAGSVCQARDFADSLRTEFGRGLSVALAESVGRTLPVPAASPGVVYHFDPDSGVFEPGTAILGQLFLERADPIGPGVWNVSLTYQRVAIDRFEGKDLGSLHDTDRAIVDRGGRATIPRFAIGLVTHEAIGSVTYGLMKDLEVNLTVPFLASDFRLDSRVHNVSQNVDQPPTRVRSSKLGVGDTLLRGKYRLLAQPWVHLAFGLVLRVPTGNEHDFQGTGNVEVAPMLYASRDPIPLGPWLHLQPYANAGVNLVAEDADRSELRWGAGLDVPIAGRLTAAAAVLGRHPFARIGRPGLFDVPRVPRPGAPSSAPLFGITARRPDFFDLSVGMRVKLSDAVFGFANAILPLNDDGFRADVIPLAGLEAVF